MKVFQLNARKIGLLLRILQISMRDTCSRIICHRTRFYSISIWFFYISFHFYSRKISPVLFITAKILYILYDWNVKSSNLVNALLAYRESTINLHFNPYVTDFNPEVKSQWMNSIFSNNRKNLWITINNPKNYLELKKNSIIYECQTLLNRRC